METLELVKFDSSKDWFDEMKKTGYNGLQSGGTLLYSVDAFGNLYCNGNSSELLSDEIKVKLSDMNDGYRTFYIIKRDNSLISRGAV